MLGQNEFSGASAKNVGALRYIELYENIFKGDEIPCVRKEVPCMFS